MVTGSKMSLGAEGAQPSVTMSELDSLDKELGKDTVTDVLGDYIDETETAVKDLIRGSSGTHWSEPMEAMDVDMEPLSEPAAEMQDQPMETEQSEPSPGTFQPEWGMPRYTPSLIRSTDSPPSPIMAKDNALLDADPDAPGLGQSKAPGAGRPERSPKSKMTLWKQKPREVLNWEVTEEQGNYQEITRKLTSILLRIRRPRSVHSILVKLEHNLNHFYICNLP